MALPASVAKELAELGFLGLGGNEKHSLKRFQRRALQTFRKTKAGPNATAVSTFKGQATGAIDDPTVAEIKIWQTNNYVAPLGYYKFVALESGGTLREDAAAAWDALAQKIAKKGGTIAGPYGDTKRPLMKSIKVGASKFRRLLSRYHSGNRSGRTI